MNTVDALSLPAPHGASRVDDSSALDAISVALSDTLPSGEAVRRAIHTAGAISYQLQSKLIAVLLVEVSDVLTSVEQALCAAHPCWTRARTHKEILRLVEMAMPLSQRRNGHHNGASHNGGSDNGR
jgi:hypothetical protein